MLLIGYRISEQPEVVCDLMEREARLRLATTTTFFQRVAYTRNYAFE